jgi:hypothetical protein
MKWHSKKTGASYRLSGNITGGWQPSFQWIKLKIPADGLNGGVASRPFRVLVNGEDYFGGEMKADPGAMLTIYLKADIGNEVEIKFAD